MDKTILIKSLLQQYYYYKQQEKDYLLELSEIDNQMVNLKAISYDKVAGIPEDRQHKLIRLMEKKESKQRELREIQTRYQTIALELDFSRLYDEEKNLLEMVYLKRFSYDEIADKLVYTNKAYISRKHAAILEKLAK